MALVPMEGCGEIPLGRVGTKRHPSRERMLMWLEEGNRRNEVTVVLGTNPHLLDHSEDLGICSE